MSSENIDINMDLFYSRKYKLEAYCESEQHGSDWWDVYLVDVNGKPDCQVGHFGKNIYFRTNAGTKSKRYKELGKMLNAIKNAGKKNNVEISKFRITTNYNKKYIIKNI